jgi:hypothetical protein
MVVLFVLFRKRRLVGLNFLPRFTAADGTEGVFEVDTGTELGEKDCVALAAGMAGELVCLGMYDSGRVLHDRQQVQRLVGKALEEFAPEARKVIEQNVRFFSALNVEVQHRIVALLSGLEGVDLGTLPQIIPIIRLAQVEEKFISVAALTRLASDTIGACCRIKKAGTSSVITSAPRKQNLAPPGNSGPSAVADEVMSDVMLFANCR